MFKNIIQKFVSFFRSPISITGHLFRIYLGLAGAGKSISLMEEEFLPRYLAGQKIWSNMWINLEGVNYFSSIDELLKERNFTLIFDEIDDILDPYRVKEMTAEHRRFFKYHRKRHIDIFATTQHVSQISKQARIHISDWIFCQASSGFLVGGVNFKKRTFTSQDLMKMNSAFGVDSLEDDNVSLDNNFSEDITFSSLDSVESPVRSVHYSKKRLAHRELDDKKIEFVYRYCSACAGRQGEQIKKEDTLKVCDYNVKKKSYSLKVPEKCPAHPLVSLEVRVSGLYDSEFELSQGFSH